MIIVWDSRLTRKPYPTRASEVANPFTVPVKHPRADDAGALEPLAILVLLHERVPKILRAGELAAFSILRRAQLQPDATATSSRFEDGNGGAVLYRLC
jgi:hypothetical protein